MSDFKKTDEADVQSSDSVEQKGDAVSGEIRDIGADLYAEGEQLTAEELEEEGKVVRKLLDRRILPMLYLTYVLQFLDKLSLNYASAYTLIPDLGLEGQRYSWVAAIFNFGYLFWAIPANLLIQRLPLAKYMGVVIIIWAGLVIAHVGAKNYAGILVLRFLLGMAEACVSPCMMNFTSMFYKRSEQPLRMSLWLSGNGMATMVGALLGFGLGHSHNTSLHSWQLIFLTIGLINLLTGCLFLWLMPDSPSTAKFLTHRQRVVAVQRVSENMIGVKTKQIKPRQAVEAIYDPKVIFCVCIGIGCGVINGGVSNFASSLIKGFGFDGIYATLLQLPTGAIEVVVVPICGLISTYVRDSRCIVLAVVCLIPFGGLLGIRFTSLEHRWTLVGCTWLQYIVGAPVIVSWNLLATNVGGHTKRSMANGLWFTMYAAGNVAGANIFFAREKPRYQSALLGLLICYAGMIVLAGAAYFYMKWENKRRDRRAPAGESPSMREEAAVLDGFKDLTDMQSKNFRYAL
ncbi:putative MFS allantoate transporter [Aspergillus clavatus NRRL 1]|uniref:MFS allantoate transporter, putative n=1 Tax=Aspergillus clavatus (strain ATCC 1007 / CBS 513.65 / DSM 816 / NCTC 3887 / NRRL 1 / QM 1276 / 107) TaxID=344612 RepID=A1CNY9_ASPCL|nr:MFS allantoate transporter, putative [Aspergillus clavatus NRRL 1]EAW07360.1 MFS allantoate transporter, putative [Aspergillus clavatus NRRL 1]